MNNLKRNLSFGLILLGSAALVACSPEEVKRSPHEKSVPAESVVRAPDLGAADSQKFNKVDVEAMAARLKTNSTESLTSVLDGLTEYILNASYVESTTYANDPKMREMLGQWNQAHLELLKSQPNLEREKKYLERYEQVVFSGCDSDLKGCMNGRFFRQDPGSARLVEEMARRMETSIAAAKETSEQERKTKDALVLKYYRYLKMSFSFRNKIADSDFEFLYLNRAADLSAAYQRMPSTGKLHEDMQQHSEIFETLLNRFSPSAKDQASREKFRAFVERFAPWGFSRTEPNPFGNGATRMLSLAAESFLYEGEKRNGKLSASLSSAISKSQSEDPQSYSQVVRNLTSRYPGLLERLGVRDDVSRDEYFYLIDRVFNEHLNLDDASQIWKGSNQKSEILLKAARTYVKIKVAEMVVHTNEAMSSIYAQRDDYQSDTLFTTALEKSHPLRTDWNQLLSRIELVRLFINRHLKGADFRLDSDEFKQIDKELTTLTSNIKYLSVYPNMMFMAFFLAEGKGTFPVQTHFGPVDIEAPKMIQRYFNGELDPFFEFGNDATKIDRLETLYAFYFTLKMGTFRSFQLKKQSQLSEEKFFEVVLGKYLEENRSMLVSALETLRTQFNSSLDYKPFLETCRIDRGLLARNQVPGSEGPTFTLKFMDLPLVTYMGSRDVGYGKDAFGFFSSKSSLRNNLQEIRTNLGSKLVFLQAMFRIMDSHLASQGATPAEREALAKKVRASLNEVENLKAQFLTEVTKRYKEVSSCLAQTTVIERDRQVRLIKAEEEHLRQVHRRLQALKNMDAGSAAAEIQKLNADLDASLALQTAGLPSDVKRVGSIAAGEYIYAEFDVLMRVRANLQKLAPSVSIPMPPGFKDTPLWKWPKTPATLSAELSEEDFVKRGLSFFNGTESAYIRWFTSTESIDAYRTRLKMLTELYKMGTIQMFSSGDQCPGGVSKDGPCMVRGAISANRLVNDLLEIVGLLSLSKNGVETEYAKYVRMTGLASPFLRREITDFLLDKEGNAMTLAESVYADLTKDEPLPQDKNRPQGGVKDKSESADEPAPIKEARQYYRTDRNQGVFLFTPDKSMDTILRGQYRPLLVNYVKRVKDFEAALLAREASDAKNHAVAEFGYEITEGKINSIKPDASSPVYLSRQRMGEFQTKMDLFEKETIGKFRAQEGDADFAKTGRGNGGAR